jgi:hypothetical protein
MNFTSELTKTTHGVVAKKFHQTRITQYVLVMLTSTSSCKISWAYPATIAIINIGVIIFSESLLA